RRHLPQEISERRPTARRSLPPVRWEGVGGALVSRDEGVRINPLFCRSLHRWMRHVLARWVGYRPGTATPGCGSTRPLDREFSPAVAARPRTPTPTTSLKRSFSKFGKGCPRFATPAGSGASVPG